MMRNIISLLLWALLHLSMHAQELTVKSFAEKTNDLAASTYERKDGNGNSCALVKVQLATAGAQFSPNVVGNVEYKVNEYWVYLPTINKHLEVKHPSFLTKDVVFADYGVKLEPKTTYSLILAIPEGGATQQVVTSQYLLFNVKPEDAIVEVNGEVWTNTNGVSRKFVPFGEYSYSVEASNYHTYSGTVTVNDPNNKTIVNVNLKPAFGSIKIPAVGALAGAIVYVDNKRVGSVPYLGENIPSGVHQVRITKPMYKSLEQELTVKDGETTVLSPELSENFATVTLSVGNEAQIFVNDELKGSGSWIGELEYGDYNIKTQKKGHRQQSKVYTISKAYNHQTITLTPPIPIYGSVNISVLPDESDVFLDGKKVGTTPLFLQQILIGDHKLEVKKEGFKNWVDNISIQENTTCHIEKKELVRGSADNITFNVNGVSFDMIMVKAGTFMMGAVNDVDFLERHSKPSHQVTLTNNYYIGATKVTPKLWKAVMGGNCYDSRIEEDDIVVRDVSWNQCKLFLAKLNAITGKKFRLPTEAEWEFAARGGNNSRHYKYSGSNDHDSLLAAGIPNELGIYGMSDKVGEWCSDYFESYSSSAQTNPIGPTSGTDRVVRGGWDGIMVSSTSRSWKRGSAHGNGLRLVFTAYEPTDCVQEIDKDNTFEVQQVSPNVKKFIFNGIPFNMVKVDAGSFMMGATSEMKQAQANEKPIHKVTLTTNYYLCETVVTQALWEAVMGYYDEGNYKPVEASWEDCQDFIFVLNKATGYKFRLPTEAEWEFAARGGKKSRHYQYSGSNTWHQVAWCAKNSGEKLQNVASKLPNELGLYDMSGNVYEWCSDWYGKYPQSPQTNPKGPTTGDSRVIRGGSCNGGTWECRSSSRSGVYSWCEYGLRLALSE